MGRCFGERNSGARRADRVARREATRAREAAEMGLFGHSRKASLGQPLLDLGEDRDVDILPPNPEELPPSTPNKDVVSLEDVIPGINAGTPGNDSLGSPLRLREVRVAPSRADARLGARTRGRSRVGGPDASGNRCDVDSFASSLSPSRVRTTP